MYIIIETNLISKLLLQYNHVGLVASGISHISSTHAAFNDNAAIIVTTPLMLNTNEFQSICFLIFSLRFIDLDCLSWLVSTAKLSAWDVVTRRRCCLWQAKEKVFVFLLMSNRRMISSYYLIYYYYSIEIGRILLLLSNSHSPITQ